MWFFDKNSQTNLKSSFFIFHSSFFILSHLSIFSYLHISSFPSSLRPFVPFSFPSRSLRSIVLSFYPSLSLLHHLHILHLLPVHSHSNIINTCGQQIAVIISAIPRHCAWAGQLFALLQGFYSQTVTVVYYNVNFCSFVPMRCYGSLGTERVGSYG